MRRDRLKDTGFTGKQADQVLLLGVRAQTKMTQKMDARFQQILTTLEQRFEQADQRTALLEKRIDQNTAMVEKRFDMLEKRFNESAAAQRQLQIGLILLVIVVVADAAANKSAVFGSLLDVVKTVLKR